MKDDISEAMKRERLNRLIEVVQRIQQEEYRKEAGKVHLLLMEDMSRKSSSELKGYTDSGKRCVIPNRLGGKEIPLGSFVSVRVGDVVGKTLRGIPLAFSSIRDFYHSS